MSYKISSTESSILLVKSNGILARCLISIGIILFVLLLNQTVNKLSYAPERHVPLLTLALSLSAMALAFLVIKLFSYSRINFLLDQQKVRVDRKMFFIGKPYFIDFSEIKTIEVIKSKVVVGSGGDYDSSRTRERVYETILNTISLKRVKIHHGFRKSTNQLLSKIKNQTSLKVDERAIRH